MAVMPGQPLALLLLLLLMSLGGDCDMTNKMRQEALDAHNYLRKNVYPEAVAMSRLSWSSELEELARRAAGTCVFEHSTGNEYQHIGENMYLGGKDNFTEILTMMFLERELYDYENVRCLAGSPDYTGPYTFLQTCGHYLQLVRSDMTTVGCSINRCVNPVDGSANNLAVCEYESMYKEPPYRARKPSENPCELCGYQGYAIDCDGDLCTVLDMENPKESPVQRKCLNCGNMLSYGVFSFCMCENNFYGEVCESSIESVPPESFSQTCDKCQQDNVQCLNGATPDGTGDTCRCVCAAGFTGKYCEIDTEEEANTLHLYLGGSKRYYSYYPVEKKTWNAADDGVKADLATALSNYCTTGSPRVKLSANYPATTINGSLKIGLHAKCGRRYLEKSQLKAALDSVDGTIAGRLASLGVAIVKVD